MPTTINLREAKMWQMKKSLYAFLCEMWDAYETAQYSDIWLMEYLCECFQYSVKHFLPNYVWRDWITDDEYNYIKEKSHGECPVRDKLINGEHVHNHDWNMPPRHSKSSILNICGPVWLGLNSPISVASVSHTERLSTEMNTKRQKLLESDKFKYYFTGSAYRLKNSTASMIRLNSGSTFYSVCQSSFTGFGADVIIADDLTSADNARKDGQVLRNSIDFFRKTLPTRLNTKKTGVIWHIEQRIARGDVSGYIQEDKDLSQVYSHTEIQAIATDDRVLIYPCSGKVKIIKKGEKLWPERFGDYSTAKMEMGIDEFNTQYQQDAGASASNIVKEQYIHYISEEEFRRDYKPMAEFHYGSHDCPVKDKEINDYHGFAEGYGRGNELVICEAWQEHLGYIKEKELLVSLENIDPAIIQIVEDKANGGALLQDLSSQLAGLAPFNPGTDSKSQRLSIAATYMQNGAVRFVKSDKTSEAISSLLKFPFLVHDDVVDAISQMIIYHFTSRRMGIYTNSFTYQNIIPDSVRDNSQYLEYGATINGDTIKVLGINRMFDRDEYVVEKEYIFIGINKFEQWAKELRGNLLLDCSYENRLFNLVDKNSVFMTKFNDTDTDKSFQLVKSGFYNNKIKICNSCSQTKNDIAKLRITESSRRKGTDVQETLDEGMAGCVRGLVTYFKGIGGQWY